MKVKIILPVLFFIALTTLAQTNFISITNQSGPTNRIFYRLVIVTNWYRAANNFRQFGNEVIDINKQASQLTFSISADGRRHADGPLMTSLSGTVNSVNGNLLVLDVYKYHEGPAISDSLSSEGNFIGGSGYVAHEPGWSEYDKTVVVTNYPNFKEIAENQKISVTVKRSGTLDMNGHILELYDYGQPWTYRIVSTNKIAVHQ